MEHKVLETYIGILYELHVKGSGDYIQGKLDVLSELFNFTWGRKKEENQPKQCESWVYRVYERDTGKYITSRTYPKFPAMNETHYLRG